HVAVEHGDADGRVFDEPANLRLAPLKRVCGCLFCGDAPAPPLSQSQAPHGAMLPFRQATHRRGIEQKRRESQDEVRDRRGEHQIATATRLTTTAPVPETNPPNSAARPTTR